jgi:hypothetical protein
MKDRLYIHATSRCEHERLIDQAELHGIDISPDQIEAARHTSSG